MPDQEVNPEKAPSGAKATGFAEILVRVWITSAEDVEPAHAEAMILANPEMPQVFMEAAAQHLVAAAALEKDVEFDKAIDDIAEGAKTAHSRLLRRRPISED